MNDLFARVLASTVLIATSGCASLPFSLGPCPNDMVMVGTEEKGFCLDRYEYTPCPEGNVTRTKPAGGMSYYDCEAICTKAGKRLPNHAEWKLGCAGTPVDQCNRKRAHPIIRMASNESWSHRGKNCKRDRNRWSKKCMIDYRINLLPDSLATNGEFPECVSQWGAHHMIGNLGEWVSDVRLRAGREMGRFNGGLYPQPASSCDYSTTAHDTDYRDYSIGCRCAKDLDQSQSRY